jgi:AcrR family transcriptional regulator
LGGSGWRYPTPTRPVPVPRQQRAAETIRAAIDATIDLLDRLPEHQVTLEAIRERSGVSQGSLTHHFGGRDGLVATSHVARYERCCDADATFLGRYAGALDAAETFAATMLVHIEEMLSAERREVRWIRMSAIAAAFGDADLTATLRTTYTKLADGLTAYAEEARRNGLVLPDTDARTLALLLSMHAQGIVLDDLVEQEVPVEAWNHMMVRFVASFLAPAAVEVLVAQAEARFGNLWRAEVFGGPGRVPSEVAARLDVLRSRGAARAERSAGPEDVHDLRRLLEQAERGGDPSRARQVRSSATGTLQMRAFTAGIAMLREHGGEGVDVNAIRAELALSPQAFHRMFGSREAFVRELRIRLEIARSAHSTARFAKLVADATSPAEMRTALETGAIRMQEEASRAAMWQRIETLAASRTDVELRISLARIQGATRDLLIEQVCLAQSRGLIDPELPGRSVARLLDGTVFWHVFHGLDLRAPSREGWIHMLERIAALLSPDLSPDVSPGR